MLSIRPENCGFEKVELLTMGWPLGQPFETSADARQYVRDPTGAVSDLALDSFESPTQMPADALFSGYAVGQDELWLSPTTVATSVYVVRSGVPEKWPRVRELVACA